MVPVSHKRWAIVPFGFKHSVLPCACEIQVPLHQQGTENALKLLSNSRKTWLVAWENSNCTRTLPWRNTSLHTFDMRKQLAVAIRCHLWGRGCEEGSARRTEPAAQRCPWLCQLRSSGVCALQGEVFLGGGTQIRSKTLRAHWRTDTHVLKLFCLWAAEPGT